jgi:hypothetical protein
MMSFVPRVARWVVGAVCVGAWSAMAIHGAEPGEAQTSASKVDHDKWRELPIPRAWYDHRNIPLGTFDEGENFGFWHVDYDGYGAVRGLKPADTRQRVVDLRPEIQPRQAGTTAALVSSRVRNRGDVVITLRMRSLAQNATSRQPAETPNPWEVGWIMWNATTREGPGDQGTGIPTDVTEHCYYLVLKTNGWELGKLDQSLFTDKDEGGQRYLATGTSPRYAVGKTWREVTITQIDATITVEVDGRVLTRFTDGPGSGGYGPWSDHPDQEVYTSGAVRLYTEDAHAQFTDLVVAPVPTTSAGHPKSSS